VVSSMRTSIAFLGSSRIYRQVGVNSKPKTNASKRCVPSPVALGHLI
jgi:hypothetical protein